MIRTSVTKTQARLARRLIAAGMALVLACATCAGFPLNALAYYTLGTVEVDVGTTSISVQEGLSTSTSVVVSPASSDQTLGCGMAKCPQVCEGDDVISAGYTCFDENGQCTCSGKEYSTYYSSASVSSSNSAVATASLNGNTLTVTGVSAGSATISITGSLRQFDSGYANIEVTVTEAPGSGSNTNSGATSNTNSGTSGRADSSNPVNRIGLPEEAQVAQATDTQLNEQVTETVAGTVRVVQINSFLDTAEQLAKLESDGDQVIFWSGASSDKPSYSWTFVNDQVDKASAKTSFDPTVTLSKLGTGVMSNLLQQARDSLAIECAYKGSLPGTASLYINVSDTYSDGQHVGLYAYDQDKRAFSLVQEGLEVQGGYLSFETDKGGVWAVSTDDLTKYQVQEANTPGAIVASSDSFDSSSQESGLPVAGIVSGVVAVVAVVAGAGVVMARRRPKADASADNASEDEQALAQGQNVSLQDGEADDEKAPEEGAHEN